MSTEGRSNVLAGFAALTAIGAFLMATVGVIVAVNSGGGTVTAAAAPITVTLNEFSIVPNPVHAPAGEVTLSVNNAGGQLHNLVLRDGPKTSDLGSGETEALSLGELAPGTYEIYCDIPGHLDAGMLSSLVVDEEGAAPPADDGGGHGSDWAAMDTAMEESILNFSALNPEWDTGAMGNVPLEPVEVEADGTKVFELTAAITPWKVDAETTVDAWTYNGMVPGPWIRLDLGDKVKVRVHNELPLGTDIHWHGAHVPFDQDGVAPLTQPLIASGDSYTYAFTASRPAVAMYHPHHHGQLKLPNGMFGAITVGTLGQDIALPTGQTIGGIAIPEDLQIAQEFPMVVNDSGVIGLTLNGKSFPSTDGYAGNVGDWIVVHYYNEGNQVHPMHLHQFEQLVIAKDGIALDQPYWADTVNVAPGERYSVLFNLSSPGVWVWHCHILNHAESETGMFGMVTAWIVGTPGEDFELGGTGSAE